MSLFEVQADDQVPENMLSGDMLCGDKFEVVNEAVGVQQQESNVAGVIFTSFEL